MNEDDTTLPIVATDIRLQSPSGLSAHAFEHRYRPDEQHRQRNRSASPSSVSSSSSAESMFERSSRSQYKNALSSTSHSQERTPITPHTALSSPPTSARDSNSTGGLLVPGPPARKAKNRKQLSLSTTAAQQLAPQATVAQQPTPSGQVSHSVPSTPMTAVATAPGMRRGVPPKLPQLNMAMLSLTRRPSLPVMGQGSPVGELDPGFSLVRGATPVRARRSGLTLAPLKSVRSREEDWDKPPSTPRYGHAGGDESDASNAAVYTSGPVCVIHPHLWLFANPTLAQAKEYDVVINVAKEIASPLLEEASDREEATMPLVEDERRSPFPWTRSDGAQVLERATGPAIKSRKLAGVEYVHVPWQHNASLAQDLPSLTAYMDRCLKQEKRVLVHCQQGVSRSASLVIAYVMKSMGKDVNEAYGFVKHESPWIGPNMTLIYQLCEWGKLLKREREEAREKSNGSGGRIATDYYHRHRRSLDLSKLTSTKREGSLARQGATSAAAATFDHSMRGMLSRRPSVDPSPASAATVTGVYAHGLLSSPHELPCSPAQPSRYPEDVSGLAALVSPRKRPRAVSSLLERTRTRSVAPEASSVSTTSAATGMPSMATLRDSLTSQNGPQQAPVLKPHRGALPSPSLRLNGVAMQNEGG